MTEDVVVALAGVVVACITLCTWVVRTVPRRVARGDRNGTPSLLRIETKLDALEKLVVSQSESLAACRRSEDARAEDLERRVRQLEGHHWATAQTGGK